MSRIKVYAIAQAFLVALLLPILIPTSSNAYLVKENVTNGLKEANSLVDDFVKDVESADRLLVLGKNLVSKFAVEEFENFTNSLKNLEARNRVSKLKLESLVSTFQEQCREFIAKNGNSISATEIVDTCSELLDSLAAASDAQAIAQESLDLLKPLNLELSKLSSRLEADAKAKAAAEAAAKIAQDKAVAEAKAAAEAAAKIAADTISSLQNDFSLLTTNFNATLAKYNDALSQLESLKATIRTLENQIAELSKPKETSIVCTKGNTFKIVKKINPTCPRGYVKR